MDIYDEEMISLWTAFISNKLEFIMVGGFATNMHGYSRTTNDIDIWIKDTLENRRKLKSSIEDFDYKFLFNFENMEFVSGWTSFKVGSGMELDIMTYLKGFPQERFDECLKYASYADIYGLKIPFMHINHLIEAKIAANRGKDKIDVEELEKIKLLRN